jgi:inward rectifier potassium channel
MAPATLYGHVVSAIEIVCGVVFTAIMTGLLFVRFSKPRSKILFDDQAVVTSHNCSPTLMVRVANGSLTLLTNATVRLGVLLPEVIAEGHSFRYVHDLALSNATLPIRVDVDRDAPNRRKQSPRGLRRRTVRRVRCASLLIIEARDHALGAAVHDMRIYMPEEVLFGTHYAEAVTFDDQNRPFADLTRLSLVEADGVGAC